jgi:uncharacterized protein YbjT (DUF2867 family)
VRKLLVVFGTTGNQGGSIIDNVLNDPVLSHQYKIRAVTRDSSKPAAQVLLNTDQVEVVQGDADNPESLKQVLVGAHTVYALTTTIYDERLEERELSQGKAIADAAVAAGAEYLIFSTLFHIARVSGGKYDKGRHFDCKAEVEDYIRALPIKSAFFAPGSFMQNFGSNMKPRARQGTGPMCWQTLSLPTPSCLLSILESQENLSPLSLPTLMNSRVRSLQGQPGCIQWRK